jgi:hypothetical protein
VIIIPFDLFWLFRYVGEIMARFASIQFILLFCCLVAWLSALVVPCIAQESATLGIFSATADWGLEPEFGPQVGNYKVPGRVDITESDEGLVYDVYGNGDGIHGWEHEGFFVYTERNGSWSLSAKIEYIDGGGEESNPKICVMLCDQATESNSTYYLTFKSNFYSVKRIWLKSLFRVKDKLYFQFHRHSLESLLLYGAYINTFG